MPASADIYGQIQQPQAMNPLASLAQAYQIKAYQGAADKAARETQTQNRLLELVGGADFAKMPTAQKATALQGVGAFDQAGKLVTTEAAANKDQRSADSSAWELKAKKLDVVSMIAGTVKDQASYDRALGMLGGLEVDTSKFSPTYDPAGVAQFAQATLTAKDRLLASQDDRKFGETQRHNGALEANAAGNLGVAQGNLGVAQGNLAVNQDRAQTARVAAENGRIPAGYRQNPDGSQSFIKGGPADPDAAKKAGLTEDQGKATGWLVQAENAFKNMKEAGFSADGTPKSAAKPGFADAVAGVPFMGAVGNTLRSPDRQMFVQGASSLSESLLRAATGAGVNRDEALQKVQELTPQWGEDAATTKQKMAAIPLYIETLKVRAGPGAAKASTVLAGGAQAATPAAQPATTRKVIGGKTYENDGKGWYAVN